ncbi:thioredoxin family protein [Clostridium oceanicum]|uniref:Thioredoxin-like fold domain-containing protein n=1 Tax=Clostridium oceanicum TaxID=1543 RepID=A0ABP3UQB6_9CLOT
MDIKVLGSGCCSCNSMDKEVREAVKELGLDAKVEYITDMGKVLSYGVMKTPALVIDGKVVVSGRKLSCDEVKKYLK